MSTLTKYHKACYNNTVNQRTKCLLCSFTFVALRDIS